MLSFQVGEVRQIAGPLPVALLTCRLRFAAVMDSPAASVGTLKRRYGVARVALPVVCSTSASSVVCPPEVEVGDCWRAIVSATAVNVTVRLLPLPIVTELDSAGPVPTALIADTDSR